MRGVARRRNKADLDFGGALAVCQAQAEALHTAGARLQKSAQLQQQAARGEHQRLGLAHLGRQFDVGGETLRRHHPDARISESTERLVEALAQRMAKPLRQPGARLG